MTKLHRAGVRSFMRASFLACLTVFLPVDMATAQSPDNSALPAAKSRTDSTQGPNVKRTWKWWKIKDRSYYDPLLAEPRAAQVTALAYAKSSRYEYMIKEDRTRQMWDISLGKEIPLFGIENCDLSTARFEDKCSGFGLWLPVSFHMVEDFNDSSSPVINNDNRFSLLAKGQWGHSWGFVSARLQVGHESTHLGDEFTIHASDFAREHGTVFERVNVTYEYWEYGISFEIAPSQSEHVFTVRHGGIGLLNNKKGFYATRLLNDEEGYDTLTASKKNFEPSFGFEWRRPNKAIFKTKYLENWAPLASVDVRLKTVYDYHRPPNTSENREWSVSALVGVSRMSSAINAKGVPILIGRFYYGVNPNGQFRNQSHYHEWGLGFIVPL
jgi:hypothetical protein